MTDTPQHVVESLSRVTHVSAARAKRFVDQLGIQTIDDLIRAAESGQLTNISGIGQKTQASILDAARAFQIELAAARPQAAPTPETQDEPSQDKGALVEGERPDKDDPELEHSSVEDASEGAAEKHADDVDDVQSPEDLAEGNPTEVSNDDVDSPDVVSASTFLRDVLICPNCGHDSFEARFSSVVCIACRREYSQHLGAVDMVPPDRSTTNLTQRLMETTFYAKYYEGLMRPRLTRTISKRSMDEEFALSTKYLAMRDGARVLDVACGTGNFTRYFAQAARKKSLEDVLIVGVDLSATMLGHARNNVDGAGFADEIALLRADASRLPLQNSSFTHVHCAAALHFMDDPDEVLRQFARILQPDGICVISTFIKGKGLLRRGIKRLAKIPTSFGWFDINDLHQRLNQSGFEVIAESVEGDALTLKTRRI